MTKKPYKRGKRGAGRHVQLPEYLQATEAWSSLPVGPRALYIELKRRYNGRNNGRIILSHREAAIALNVHRNTIGPWFKELERRELVAMTRAPYLGPEGVGRATWWALQELPTLDGKPATLGFLKWTEVDRPRTKSGRRRHTDCDGRAGPVETGA